MALIAAVAIGAGASYFMASSKPSQCIAENDTNIVASMLCEATTSAVTTSALKQEVDMTLKVDKVIGLFVNICQGGIANVHGSLGSKSIISQVASQDQNLSASLQQIAHATQKAPNPNSTTKSKNNTKINVATAEKTHERVKNDCSAKQKANFTLDVGTAEGIISVNINQVNTASLNLAAQCLYSATQSVTQKQSTTLDIKQSATAYQEGSTLGGAVTQIFMYIIMGIVLAVVVCCAIASITWLHVLLLCGIGAGYIVCSGFSYIKFMGLGGGEPLYNSMSESVRDCDANKHAFEVAKARFHLSRHICFTKPLSAKTDQTLSGYDYKGSITGITWQDIDAALAWAATGTNVGQLNGAASAYPGAIKQAVAEYKTPKKQVVLPKVTGTGDTQTVQPLAAVWYRDQQYEKGITSAFDLWPTSASTTAADNTKYQTWFQKLQTTPPPPGNSATGTLQVFQLTTPISVVDVDQVQGSDSNLVHNGAELIDARLPIGPELSNGGVMPQDPNPDGANDKPFMRVPFPMSKDAEISTGDTVSEQSVLVVTADSGKAMPLGQTLKELKDNDGKTIKTPEGMLSMVEATEIEHVICPYYQDGSKGKDYWKPPLDKNVLKPWKTSSVRTPNIEMIRAAANPPTDSPQAWAPESVIPAWLFGNPIMDPNISDDETPPVDSVANTVMVFYVRDTGQYLPAGPNKDNITEFGDLMEQKRARCRTEMMIYLIVYACILFVHIVLTFYKMFGGAKGEIISVVTWIAGAVGFALLIYLYVKDDAFNAKQSS